MVVQFGPLWLAWESELRNLTHLPPLHLFSESTNSSGICRLDGIRLPFHVC